MEWNFSVDGIKNGKDPVAACRRAFRGAELFFRQYQREAQSHLSILTRWEKVTEVRKSELIAAIQKEILRHDFGTFVDNPPSVAQGGRGVVVPGCTTCTKRANTTTQFLEHIAKDAIPALIEQLSRRKAER